MWPSSQHPLRAGVDTSRGGLVPHLSFSICSFPVDDPLSSLWAIHPSASPDPRELTRFFPRRHSAIRAAPDQRSQTTGHHRTPVLVHQEFKRFLWLARELYHPSCHCWLKKYFLDFKKQTNSFQRNLWNMMQLKTVPLIVWKVFFFLYQN